MSEKKKILICHRSMHLGGSEKALLALLSSYDYDQTDVRLELLEKNGELLDFVPKEVVVDTLSINDIFPTIRTASPYDCLRLLWKKKRYFSFFVYIVLYYLQKNNPKYRILLYYYFLRDTRGPTSLFDEAHSFYGLEEILSFYVAEKVNAKTKISWIHVDVSKWGFDKAVFLSAMKKHQIIHIVSKQGKDVFDAQFPQLKEKTTVRYNIIPKERIQSLSLSAPSFTDFSLGKRILTLGRLSPEKGQRIALSALKIIREEGIDVKWYFIGDGPDKEYCLTLADQLGLSDATAFLGKQINPYGYLKDCDLYVQPSQNEGFCIALAEAICFNKPIVATDFVGAREQLDGNLKALIVPCNPQELAKGIITLMGIVF